MKHRFQKLCASFVLFTALTSISYAQHAGDVEITIDDNKIVTEERVYGTDLNSTYFTTEPGFDAVPGTFNPGALVGFDFLGAIKIWNGTDFDTVAMPRLLMNDLEANTILSPSADVFQAGLAVAANGSGEWHEHFGMRLRNSTGNALPAQPPIAEVGIYLLEMQLSTNQPGIDPSLPFYFVINNGDSEANHNAAIAYQSAVVAIPEPGTWALLVCGLGAVGYGVGQKARRRLLPVA